MHIRMIVWFLRIPCLLVLPFLALDIPAQEEKEAEILEGEALIRKLPSPQQGGSGYELVYAVDAPLDILRAYFDFVGAGHDSPIEVNIHSKKCTIV